MSALPPKADITAAQTNVPFVPDRTFALSRAQTEKPPRGGFSKISNFKEPTDGTVRSLKLDHVDAGQRDLVNDRTRQSVSCNLIFIGIVARHSIHRHDHVKTAERSRD